MAREESGAAFFTPELMKFLRDLGRNNNRPWFEANKTRYEAVVQDPAVRFIEAMGPRLARISAHLVADPRPFGGSLMRIYRDTRFSKDKSPYKTQVGIHFPYDRAAKGEHFPGFFFHIRPGESELYAGVWHPEPPHLKKIRDAIVDSPGPWGKLQGKGIEIGGESHIRVPAGYDPKHKYAEDLRHKDFFAGRSIPDAQLSHPKFGEQFIGLCEELDPLNRFLAKAIGIPW
ncbi:MAG: DUF2461 domain-containing protein [Thermoplasmata archaeon]